MMASQNNYLKLFGGIVLLSGLAFVAIDKDNSVSNDELISITKGLENRPIPAKESQSIADLKNTDHQILQEELENPFEGQEVKARLQQVAEQFAEEIKYPSFSMPIRNENELSKYQPNLSISSSRPINLDDSDAQALEDGPRISLKTSKFRYYKGDQVLAEAEVTGIDGTSSISVSGLVMVDKKVIARATEVVSSESARNQNSHQYKIRFDDLSNLSSDMLGDMDVVAEFTIDGQNYAISSLIRYPNIVATLDNIGSAEIQDEYLMIPAFINTSSPGLFSISGNLYDAESNTPLVHLNAIEEVKSESGVIELKAHIVSLKKMGHEGPYELKDISLSRGPSEPNFVMEEGLVETESFSISGFPFSEYEDVPFVDERAQARLNFLTQLGSTN